MVFTAAALAVGAVTLTAGAATAAATIATAVVAVSAAIGVAGLAVTAVGMITGDKTLSKVGQIMGYVGLAGGLAGGVIGGVGGMLEGGAGFMAGAKGAYTGAADFAKQGWDKGVGSIFNPTSAEGVMAPVGAGVQGAKGIPLAPGVAPNQAELGASLLQGPVGPPSSAVAPVSTGVGNFPSTSISTGMSQANSVAAKVAPSAGILQAPQTAMAVAPAVTQATSVMNSAPAVASTGSQAAASAKGAFDSMPDWMKLAAATTGMQGISGLASGWFQGASAEEQLEFQKLINQQNQNQVQYLNKNAAYAPLLNFTNHTGPAGV